MNAGIFPLDTGTGAALEETLTATEADSSLEVLFGYTNPFPCTESY